MLRGLCKSVSSGLFLVDVGRMFAQPTLELVVPLEQQLECFADDVGRICADELGVSVQVVSDFFLQANLKGCSFGCFDGAFSSGNCFPPFLFRGVVRLALQTVCSDLCTRTKHGPERLGAGGSDPTTFWAAESRTKWGRSRPSECFVRVQMSPVSFTHPLFFEESVVGLVGDFGTEAAPEVPRICQPSPHLLLLSPNTASWPGTVTARNKTFCVFVLVVVDSARKSFGN